MDYEIFYQEAQGDRKNLKDSVGALSRLLRRVEQERESGDMKSLERDLKDMAAAAGQASEALEGLENQVSDFDVREYLESGDFEAQMLEQCREQGVDVRGESQVYEMFPYRVRLDSENQDIYLDRKKASQVRPRSFVAMVKKNQEKLNRASFNAQTFLTELAGAYDLAVLKLGKRPESDIYLTSLYKFLAPMSRFRREYDQQSFAYDLARLYASQVEETKNGRKYQFGPSRNNSKAIRILDGEGQEQFLATIRFYE